MYTLQISSKKKEKKEEEKEARKCERERERRQANHYHTVDCHAKASRTITKRNSELKLKLNNDY
jgi:hypothetical protein